MNENSPRCDVLGFFQQFFQVAYHFALSVNTDNFSNDRFKRKGWSSNAICQEQFYYVIMNYKSK